MGLLDRIQDSFKYLDKNGLKHLIEKIKAHDVHWTGTHAEYEAVKDTIPAYAILHFTDDYDENVQVGIYSTEETKTGELWIDNKPIYRKVLNISTSAFTEGNNWVNISIPNLETVVDMKGVTKHNTESSNYVLPVSPQSDTSRLMLDTISSSSLLVSVGSWWVENKIHYSELNVILEYTKTTD